MGLAACGRYGFASGDAASATAHDGASDTRATDSPVVDARLLDAATDVALGPCTPLSISDNFDDGTPNAEWTVIANNPVNTTETGGELQVTLATAGGAHYGGYDSAAPFDLRDHCMFVTFAAVPTNEAMVEMTLTARTATAAVGFVEHTGELEAFYNPGTFMSLGAVTYDPTQHKVLLVREDSGIMTWETSADGVAFTVFTTQPTPTDVSASTIALEAGTYGSAPAPGTATYDNFDLP